MRNKYDDNMLDDDSDHGGELEPASSVTPPANPSRAWRSIERYREMKELRKHLDDYFIDTADFSSKDLPL